VLYSRIFKNFLLKTHSPAGRELEANCYYKPTHTFYGLPFLLGIIKVIKTVFLDS
jgi:hypothetical protein